jgi:colanic acid/amylovoran biosynthesis glycosyltransferase
MWVASTTRLIRGCAAPPVRAAWPRHRVSETRRVGRSVPSRRPVTCDRVYCIALGSDARRRLDHVPDPKRTMAYPKIAYIMSRFPHLPETFILREMDALEKLGWDVVLCPLILQRQAVVHTEAQPWVPRAKRLPYLSPGILAASALALLRQPRTTLGILATVVAGHWRHPAVLVRVLALLPKMFLAARVLAQADVEHVHAHYATYPALAAWVVSRLTGLPYSVTVHAHDLFMSTPMLEEKLGDARFVAAISEFNRDFIARQVSDRAARRTTVVRCGVRVADYLPATPPPEKDGATLELLTVGSLQVYKGQIHLLRACRLLRDRGMALRCRIIGGGPEQEHLEAEIERLRLQGTVELLGPQPQEEVARLLPTAHCYVQPSVVAPTGQMEGIPVSIMEAMASCLPVVATDLSGVGELVRSGETGWLVAPASPEALAAAVAEVAADPQRASKLGSAGRELVRDEYDLESNVARLADLFEDSLGRHKDGS